MLTITILANDIMNDNLYYVNIFQNTHVAAYGKTHMHTPPKVFIQLWINVTQLVESKTRASCGQRDRPTKYKMTKCNKNPWIYNTMTMTNTDRWWYINRRIRCPTKI